MNSFLKDLKDIENPEIINGIQSKNPYVICDLLEQTGGGMYLKQLEDAIIETNDIVQIYEFMFLAVDMQIPGFDRDRFEKIIRESKNPKLMCYCMGFVPGTNIQEMLKELIETQNTKYLSMILDNEEYADVLAIIKRIYPNFDEIVEESKKFDYYPESLEDFIQYKGDIRELKEQIKDTRNPHLITELANYIQYLNEYKDGNYSIDDLKSIQEEIGDPMQAYEFLASVNMEEKEGLINAVIKSGKSKFMYYIYEYVPGLKEEEKENLKKTIIEQDSNGKYSKKIIESKGEIVK